MRGPVAFGDVPMRLESFPADATEWSGLPTSLHPGESGVATMRTRRLGEIQLRLVEYSAGYLADHWCGKGHIVFVLEGHLVIEHQDGPAYALTAGMSYHVADSESRPHRVRSQNGGTIFIVD